MNHDSTQEDLLTLRNLVENNRSLFEHEQDSLNLAIIVERTRSHELSLRLARVEARIENIVDGILQLERRLTHGKEAQDTLDR